MRKIQRVGALLLLALAVVSCKPEPLAPDEMRDGAGNVYKTITIGTQVWMASDLDALYVNQNNSAMEMMSTEMAEYLYPNGDARNESYGLLYRIEAARELLPKGWRIPTQHDLEVLAEELGTTTSGGAKSIKAQLQIKWYPGSNVGNLPNRGFGAIYAMLIEDNSSMSGHGIALFPKQDYSSDGLYEDEVTFSNPIGDGQLAGSVRFVKNVDLDEGRR